MGEEMGNGRVCTLKEQVKMIIALRKTHSRHANIWKDNHSFNRRNANLKL